MAQLHKRDIDGGTVETPREATQSENSKNSLGVLAVSLIAAVIAGFVMLWYFGALPGMDQTPTVQPG
jgi:hypothetical protein